MAYKLLVQNINHVKNSRNIKLPNNILWLNLPISLGKIIPPNAKINVFAAWNVPNKTIGNPIPIRMGCCALYQASSKKKSGIYNNNNDFNTGFFKTNFIPSLKILVVWI